MTGRFSGGLRTPVAGGVSETAAPQAKVAQGVFVQTVEGGEGAALRTPGTPRIENLRQRASCDVAGGGSLFHGCVFTWIHGRAFALVCTHPRQRAGGGTGSRNG